jgi:hypothetical protein
VEPLEVADQFIHETFQLMKEGVLQKYSHLSDAKLNRKNTEAFVSL